MFAIFRKPLVVTRVAAGGYVGGVWQEGAPVSIDIRASVQPTSPEDMELLPEGRRGRLAYTLFSDTELRTADSNTGTNADRVTIDGAVYEVSAVAPWQNSILPHYRAVVTLEPEQS